MFQRVNDVGRLLENFVTCSGVEWAGGELGCSR